MSKRILVVECMQEISSFNPLPSGAYLLKARKRVYGLTPLKQRRRERSPMVGAFAKPTSKVSSRP